MKTLTAEQQSARDARRSEFARLAGTIAKLSDAERATLASKCAIVTVEGHPLSPFNTCLIAAQCPAATIVGGFKQWLRAGRCVRKGEHGLAIWVPTVKKDADTDNAETRFVMGTVFDCSQTDALEVEAAA